MSESQNLSVQLAQALRARDAARSRPAPEQEIQAADTEVERLRALVRNRLDETTTELGALRREAQTYEIRYKTGEYTQAQYQNATADIRRRIASQERLEESFSTLLQAESEAAARHVSGGTAASRGGMSVAGVTPTARDDVSDASGYAASGQGAGGIPAPRWMLIGSGVLVAFGAVALVILLIQSAAGSFSLPALPSVFQRGGDTGDAPPTSAPTSPPATAFPTATAAPAGAEFQIPIQLRAAQDLGSLYVSLDYDPAVVEIVRLDYAALPSNTLADHEIGQGRVTVGVVNAGGFDGDWTVAFMTCRRAAGAPASGDSTVVISEIQAHRATDLAGLLADGSNGHINLSSLVVAAPTITFG
jgi:hypothetical protein